MRSISEYLTMTQMKALERICMITDMEGFFLPKFYVCELGYSNYLGGSGNKYYQMPMKYTELLPSQQKQVAFATHFEDAKPQRQLAQDVVDLYQLYMTSERPVIA